MGWCTAQWKSSGFMRKPSWKLRKFELARLKKKKDKHFGCLATFRFGTFAMLFSATGCVVHHENTQRWTVRCVITAYKLAVLEILRNLFALAYIACQRYPYILPTLWCDIRFFISWIVHCTSGHNWNLWENPHNIVFIGLHRTVVTQMTCQTTSTLTLTTWGQDQWYVCKLGNLLMGYQKWGIPIPDGYRLAVYTCIKNTPILPDKEEFRAIAAICTGQWNIKMKSKSTAFSQLERNLELQPN